MAWKSKPMTSDCVEFYIKVGNFTLIKETPKAIKVRLENHPKKLAIWMAKKITRGYTGTSAWFWGEALRQNIYREEQRLKANEEKMEAAFNNGFNAVHVIDPTPKDIKKVEKIIDDEINEDRIHELDPNKYVHYSNFKRK
jgi:hypothetical protein